MFLLLIFLLCVCPYSSQDGWLDLKDLEDCKETNRVQENSIRDLQERCSSKEGLPCRASFNVNTHNRRDPQKLKNIWSMEECSNKCLENPTCNFWSWHHKDAGIWAFDCVLMSDYETTNADDNVISGVKNCPRAPLEPLEVTIHGKSNLTDGQSSNFSCSAQRGREEFEISLNEIGQEVRSRHTINVTANKNLKQIIIVCSVKDFYGFTSHAIKVIPILVSPNPSLIHLQHMGNSKMVEAGSVQDYECLTGGATPKPKIDWKILDQTGQELVANETSKTETEDGGYSNIQIFMKENWTNLTLTCIITNDVGSQNKTLLVPIIPQGSRLANFEVMPAAAEVTATVTVNDAVTSQEVDGDLGSGKIFDPNTMKLVNYSFADASDECCSKCEALQSDARYFIFSQDNLYCACFTQMDGVKPATMDPGNMFKDWITNPVAGVCGDMVPSQCYAKSTNNNTMECANGHFVEISKTWDGCIHQGSHRVRCPHNTFPCNFPAKNGKEFSCWYDCAHHGGFKNCSLNDPVDCSFSDWSSWSGCSVSCGGGVQSRERRITQEALHGGGECSGDCSQEQQCMQDQCPSGLDMFDIDEEVGEGWAWEPNSIEGLGLIQNISDSSKCCEECQRGQPSTALFEFNSVNNFCSCYRRNTTSRHLPISVQGQPHSANGICKILLGEGRRFIWDSVDFLGTKYGLADFSACSNYCKTVKPKSQMFEFNHVRRPSQCWCFKTKQGHRASTWSHNEFLADIC